MVLFLVATLTARRSENFVGALRPTAVFFFFFTIIIDFFFVFGVGWLGCLVCLGGLEKRIELGVGVYVKVGFDPGHP